LSHIDLSNYLQHVLLPCLQKSKQYRQRSKSDTKCRPTNLLISTPEAQQSFYDCVSSKRKWNLRTFGLPLRNGQHSSQVPTSLNCSLNKLKVATFIVIKLKWFWLSKEVDILPMHTPISVISVQFCVVRNCAAVFVLNVISFNKHEQTPRILLY